jgi:hypothetical protein
MIKKGYQQFPDTVIFQIQIQDHGGHKIKMEISRIR